jgi:hypothetical protein
MLKINHLPEYWKLLETLPGMQEYIVFREDCLNPDGFYYDLIDRSQVQSVATVLLTSTTENEEKETILIKEEFDCDDDTIATTPHAKKVCYGTDADIKEMFSAMCHTFKTTLTRTVPRRMPNSG